MITRLLLIDSDISFIVTLKQALESTGHYRVNLAANGQAAHEALLHSPYHAVLVDFEPVDMDPLELVRMIRQMRPDLPVIMMPRDEAEMARAGAMDVQGAIPKPFTARELIAYLGEVIGRVEGPVITPPEGEVADEFSPPAVSFFGEDAPQPEPPVSAAPAGRPPVHLFSPEERDIIRQGLQDLLEEPEELPPPPQPPAPPSAVPNMSELLAEFEVFDRLQTGRLGRIQEDAGDWETIPPLTLPPGEPVDEVPSVPAGSESYQEEQSAPPLEWPGDLPTTLLLDGQPPEPASTRLLDEEEDLPTTLLLDEQGIPQEAGPTRLLGAQEDLPPTLIFDDLEAEPPPTRLLDEEQEPEPTRRLADTGALDAILDSYGWPGAEVGLGEPPLQQGDTPTVPPHNLEGMRQFLATHSGEHDASEFGDVLDAMAQTSPEEYERSPDDRAFHDLVESLRAPDMTLQRRTRLEELLASIAADAGQAEHITDSETAIDYVLEAIRRSGPGPETGETTPDDTTIGQVIDGLFEPSFEGVLAALAGEDVDDADFEEPSYDRPPAVRTEPDPADLIPPDIIAAEAPAWLAEDEPVGQPPAASAAPEPFEAPAAPDRLAEPPVSAEDSRHYPATTALAAVSGAESGDDFSLSQLLAEIEEQLPPILPRQPRLKPLPSWGKGTRLADARDLEAIFDQLQGARAEAAPVPEDTRPALPSVEPALDADTFFQDMRGREAELPEELRELAETAPGADTLDITAIFYEGVRAEAAPDSWDFAEEEAPAVEQAVDRAWQEPAEGEAAWQEPVADAGLFADVTPYAEPWSSEEEEAQPVAEAWPVEEEEQPVPTSLETAEREMAQTEEYERAEAAPEPSWETEVAQEGARLPELSDEGLIAVPVEEATRLLQGEVTAAESADETDIAQTAVELTQYSLESSAQATMLSRPGRLLAHAGELPPPAVQRLFEIVESAWRSAFAHSDALIRYITLPEAGEFLLYSMPVEGDMVLSMVFGANTSLRTIRRQARRLGESLNLIPEAPPSAEPPAARTRPRRPSLPDAQPAAVEAARAETAVAEAAVAEEAPVPAIGYTCLWLPHDPRLELRGELATELSRWLEECAQQEGWQVQALTIQTDYVQITVDVPQNQQPDQVMARLMTATAGRSAAEFPDLAFGQPLWADGYYFVTPPRALSDREIARFITFQRHS